MADHSERQSAIDAHGIATPVRIGNQAWDQIQLDIFGELMDAVYLVNKHGEAISHEAGNTPWKWSIRSAKPGSKKTSASGKCVASTDASGADQRGEFSEQEVEWREKLLAALRPRRLLRGQASLLQTHAGSGSEACPRKGHQPHHKTNCRQNPSEMPAFTAFFCRKKACPQ